MQPAVRNSTYILPSGHNQAGKKTNRCKWNWTHASEQARWLPIITTICLLKYSRIWNSCLCHPDVCRMHQNNISEYFAPMHVICAQQLWHPLPHGSSQVSQGNSPDTALLSGKVNSATWKATSSFFLLFGSRSRRSIDTSNATDIGVITLSRSLGWPNTFLCTPLPLFSW